MSKVSPLQSRVAVAFKNRQGMQLLELVISMTTASILMIGVTGSIMIANQSMEVATSRQKESSRNTSGLEQLRVDLAEAYPAANRMDSSVTLSVADRTGDGIRESISYQWPGTTGKPLQVSMNSGAWRDVTEPLDDFEFRWRSCEPIPQSAASGSFDPPNTLVFQSAVSNFDSSTNNATLGIPETYRMGDLLVLVVSIRGAAPAINVSPDWLPGPTAVNGSNATLATYYTVAPATNSVSMNWTSAANCYTTMAHFTTPGGTALLVDSPTYTATGNPAIAPAATVLTGNSLVLRVIAARGPALLDEACNMPGHIAVTMQRSIFSDPIVGMAYRYYPVGSAPVATFTLNGSADYATATMVFQP